MSEAVEARSKEDRLLEIATSLRIGERVRVSDLAGRYGVSEVTIRSDLDTLEQRQVITRVRGGAIRIAGSAAAIQHTYESELEHQLHERVEAKRALAAAAVGRTVDGDALALDDSALSMFVADELLRVRARLLVATNSVPVARRLSLKESFRVVMPGGTVRRSTESLSGRFTDSMRGNLRFRVGIFGPTAFSPRDGMLEVDPEQAVIKESIRGLCDSTVALVETTSFAAFGMHAFGTIDQIDTIVCDDDVSPKHLRDLRAQHHDVVVVEH